MKINLKFGVPILFLIVEIFFFWMTFSYPAIPAFVPRRLLVFLFVVTLWIAYREWNADKREIVSFNVEFISTLVLSLVYVVLINYVGYVISSALYMFALMVLLGSRKLFMPFVISTGFSVILFLLFTKILTVPLPHLIRGTLL